MNVALHSIELCAGIGMLGEGVRAAFKHIGFEHRTVCYVEREASAAGQLVALMETGALDEAPVWSDLVTFDGAAWRGRVDCVIAGFPCQDLSVAGKRAGLNGRRSGLFFNVADIADACGARFLILENVSGIASATASVVDETEGELDERAASRVLGELADRGWNAEWTHIRASDVGASHQRERWFCLAWRVGDAPGSRCSGRQDAGTDCGDASPRARCIESQRDVGNVGDSGCECNGAHEPERFAKCSSAADAGTCRGAMGDTDEQREQQSHDEDGAHPREWSWAGAGGSSLLMGHADGAGLQGRRDDTGQRGSEWAAGTPGVDDIFAPGPLDDRWQGIVADRPDLAPATEPGVHMLADGMAYLVDESRNHQLRQAGNGVVALQAAVAIVTLARRAGIF